MKILKFIIIIFILFYILFSCKKNSTEQKEDSDYIFTAPVSNEKLPDDLVWLTNDTDPEFASPEAKKGGTFHYFISNFPNTFRLVGPDANSTFASYVRGNKMTLIGYHPNTENIIPKIATHWAFGKDKKSMYFKLNKNARWSDGKSIMAHDFAYTLEFMRSKNIVDPWYNDYYKKEIKKVIVYDDYTLAIIIPTPKPDIFTIVNIWPIPRHYFGELSEDYVQKYNWSIEPNSGPYQISDFKKGKFVIYERKKDWWAKDLKYYRNRFNVDKVRFDVIKELNIVWEYFKKIKIDSFPVFIPEYWHDKTNISIFNNGYAQKIWFFNDARQSALGLYINQDIEIFKDINVRYAFAYAMNVEKIIEQILRNDYFRLEHDFIGYGKYTNNNIRTRRYDIKKVEEYMKKSGWIRGEDGIWIKNGKIFSVIITYSFDHITDRLVILKEEALKAGIELILEKLDSSSRYKKEMEKKHEVIYSAWSTGFRPQYWEFYHSENAHKTQTNNITNTDDPELDKLINAYRDTSDEKERIRLSLNIQKKVYDLCVFIPLFMTPYVREVYWQWWKLPDIPGTKNTDTSLFFPFVEYTEFSDGGLFWYDEKLHKETLAAMKKGIKFDPVTIIDKTYMMEILKDKEKK